MKKKVWKSTIQFLSPLVSLFSDQSYKEVRTWFNVFKKNKFVFFGQKQFLINNSTIQFHFVPPYRLA